MGCGGITRDETQVAIRLDYEEPQADIHSTWLEWSRRLRWLYGCPKRVAEREFTDTLAL